MGNLFKSRSCVVHVSIPSTTENTPTPGTRPSHHLNDEATAFFNPWSSSVLSTTGSLKSNQLTVASRCKEIGFAAILKFIVQFTSPRIPKNVTELIPMHVPAWVTPDTDADKIKATWMGHACFVLELPAPSGATRGPRVLVDPVLTARCSPFNYGRPRLAAPCAIEDLPDIDIVLVSHNHYDHMDTITLRKIEQLHHPHYFSTLGNHYYFSDLSIPPGRIHILDCFKLTCTPAQHHTSRGLFDHSKTLWGGFVLSSDPDRSDKQFSVYFTGDTGYRYVPDGSNEKDMPVCPIFKELGNKFGGFDLALLPIGCYMPREYMSSIHASPSDSVQIFKDVKARRALAMHWGTWLLGSCEPVMQPPELLSQACAEEGIEDGSFTLADLGRTVAIECEKRDSLSTGL
ncbi:hypothetical protein BS47DRAFT_1372453 [Hydnum rufescens UP504]|uniref:Metallo-beta-lactamase domain-containing protein n=1 Tax=Hydnum rufescens UP504 TaxID=1448309 RepID=A0A9P6AXI1_9AGAM|nr:hypothetical protein BS47DRAFT_1372453 [Hydnum rufescens UP504]